MSIWNVPVCAERRATPTGNAGVPLNAGCYGVTLTEEQRSAETECSECSSTLSVGELRAYGGLCLGCASAAADAPREACARCECELSVDGSCLTCLSADAKADARHLRSEVLSALADTLENGGSFAEALELALRSAHDTTATRVANGLPDSGVHVERTGEASLRFNVAGVVFTVTVGA